ncbi:MAG TPA: HAD family hydrolase [Bordetella sp.]|uniref:HAD family hydrolase n=1 Tax=Bordetella sp. TaxID=28081 RepID=UPI002ED67AFA
MPDSDDVILLFDCDNTLFDNDAVLEDLRSRMEHDFGKTDSDRYWAISETLRIELGYVDYLGAFQCFRRKDRSDTRVMRMSSFLIDYPFAGRVYPGALDALRRLRAMGRTVIVSDGDAVFQPHKIKRSGLWDEVRGRVLIYIHKETMLDEIARCYPALRYVMVDDKLRILSAMKQSWGERLTTVFVRQGHYARDPDVIAYPPADIVIEHIGDLSEAVLAARSGSDRQSKFDKESS